MKTIVLRILVVAVAVLAAPSIVTMAEPMGTAFTYQGRLTEAGSPANGLYDLEFRLYDALSGGTQVGSTISVEDQPVSAGLFTVRLDFGSDIFTGDARWLEVAVGLASDPEGQTVLAPRQELTPAPYALYALNVPMGAGWSLIGNADTDPAINFLGTTDYQPLIFRVNGGRVLRLEPTGSSPNVIAGHESNAVTGGAVGAAVAGGGASGYANVVSGNFSTVAGGMGNTAGGTHASVGGGQTNVTANTYATIGGGYNNSASGHSSTVAGGNANAASHSRSTVGGGHSNLASGSDSTIAGGYNNDAGGAFSVVPGGYSSSAGGDYSFAAGRRAKVQTAAQVGGGDTNGDEGTFVWADSSDADFVSTGPNQFLIRAAGGVGVNKSNPAAGALDVSGSGYFSGNIGIGTSTPAARLHALSTDGYAVMGDATGTSPAAVFGYHTANGNGVMGQNAGSGIGVYGVSTNNGTGVMGASNPAGTIGKLGTPEYGVYGENADGFAGYFAGDVRVTGSGCFSGNVGIGTEAPTSPLTVNGVMESKFGGVKFPDGSIQTSAAPGTTGGGSPRNPLQIAMLRWYEANQAGKLFAGGTHPVEVAFDGAHLWFTDEEPGLHGEDYGWVHKRRASDGEGLGRYSVGLSPRGLAFDGEHIWVANYTDGTVTKLLALTGQVEGTYSVGADSQPTGAAFDGANIWVTLSADDELAKLEISTGTVLAKYRLDGNHAVYADEPHGVAFDGANIWTANYATDNVTKLRASDGQWLGAYDVGQAPHGVAFDGAHIWVTNSLSNTVTRLRASDGGWVGTYGVGVAPHGVVFDGAHIWVTNSGSDNVTKLRASDGGLVGTYTVGDQPGGLAFDGANIWVANYIDGTLSKL